MAAFSLTERFSKPPEYVRLLDCGAYNIEANTCMRSRNTSAPFNSKAPRQTLTPNKVWTEKIYDSRTVHRIPNCVAFMTKTPRFPYELFSAEDLEEILCQCGINDSCECVNELEQLPEVCQGKIKRRLFVGITPRSTKTYDAQEDGSQKHLFGETKQPSDMFDGVVKDFTKFYHGCKWSTWTSQRNPRSFEVRPGPADYSLDRKPTAFEICSEKVREYKRKTSKQLRFIEMVQQKNIKDNQPGPAHYTPKLPRSTDLQFLGPKAERFPDVKKGAYPGPADHDVPRDFDPFLYCILKKCKANLPPAPPFNTTANRLTSKHVVGPGPAAYDPPKKLCRVVNCTKAPFGISSIRFKQEPVEESDEDEDPTQKEGENEETKMNECPNPSWMFKSKTIRMKPLELEPARHVIVKREKKRKKPDIASLIQYRAPFGSSEGRFRPWHNFIRVNGQDQLGPCKYNLEKPRCNPAVHRGPLFREKRFRCTAPPTPAPNYYVIGGGVETVLNTPNKRLKDNVIKEHDRIFKNWKPVKKKKTLIETLIDVL